MMKVNENLHHMIAIRYQRNNKAPREVYVLNSQVVSSRNDKLLQVHFKEAPRGFSSMLARAPGYCSSRNFYVFAFLRH